MDLLPNLPTDNLYKFLALGGLALLIACLLAGRRLFAAMRDLVERDTELVARLRVRAEELEKRPQGHTHEAIALLREEVAMRVARTPTIHAMAQTAQDDIRLLKRLSVVGASMAIMGFLLWYAQVQRFEDQILQLHYERLVQEISIASPR